jgi:hypothetical protein
VVGLFFGILWSIEEPILDQKLYQTECPVVIVLVLCGI